VVIACNTAHLFIADIERLLDHEPVSLIAATKDFLVNDHLTTVGLLASPTTIMTKLFENALAQVGIKVLVSNREAQKDIEVSIRRAIAGVIEARDEALLLSEAKKLQASGAQAVILGCTELSLIADTMQPETFTDPLNVVIEKIMFEKEPKGQNTRKRDKSVIIDIKGKYND